MDNLPPEIIVKIFSCLDPASIVTCRQVCVRWRILATKLANPFYTPQIIGRVLMLLSASNKIRDVISLRLVCKLWKCGLDLLTNRQAIFLNGVTSINSDVVSIPAITTENSNPFPSRIVRLNLCQGHDDPDLANKPPEINQNVNYFLSNYGKHVHYLQVSLEHSKCAQSHLLEILKLVQQTLKGLIITEEPSPFRFAKSRENSAGARMGSDFFETNAKFDFALENLEFLKLDDSNCKLKYTELYRKLIQNSPKLSHLEINGYQHLDMGIVRLFSSELPAQSTQNQLSLTKLKIDAEDPQTEEVLEILSKCDFPLKYLSLKVNGFGDESSCSNCSSLLHKALIKFGATLERLELKLSWYDFKLDDNFSGTNGAKLLSDIPFLKNMVKLERLKLVGFQGSVDFVKDLPSLKYLMIVNVDYTNQRLFKCEESFQELVPYLKQVYLPTLMSYQTKSFEEQKKLLNFMYEGDSSFRSKYCGLNQEGFP